MLHFLCHLTTKYEAKRNFQAQISGDQMENSSEGIYKMPLALRCSNQSRSTAKHFVSLLPSVGFLATDNDDDVQALLKLPGREQSSATFIKFTTALKSISLSWSTMETQRRNQRSSTQYCAQGHTSLLNPASLRIRFFIQFFFRGVRRWAGKAKKSQSISKTLFFHADGFEVALATPRSQYRFHDFFFSLCTTEPSLIMINIVLELFVKLPSEKSSESNLERFLRANTIQEIFFLCSCCWLSAPLSSEHIFR